MVYVMSVALALRRYRDVVTLARVSRRCGDAVASLRSLICDDVPDLHAFPRVETLCVSDLACLPHVIPRTLLRVECASPPPVTFVPPQLAGRIVTLDGFPNDPALFTALQSLTVGLFYSFDASDPLREAAALDWTALHTLPSLRTVTIRCSHHATPFPFHAEHLAAFNASLVRIADELTRRGSLRLIFRIHDCDDACVAALRARPNVAVVLTNPHIDDDVIASILSRAAVLAPSVVRPLQCTPRHLLSGVVERIAALYLPTAAILKAGVTPCLSPTNEPVDAEPLDDDPPTPLDLTALTTLRDLEVCVGRSAEVTLPTSLTALSSNTPVANIGALPLRSLKLFSAPAPTALPSTLTALHVESLALTALAPAAPLLELSIHHCTALRTLALPPTLTFLDLLNTPGITALESPATLRTLRLALTGIPPAAVPPGVTLLDAARR